MGKDKKKKGKGLEKTMAKTEKKIQKNIQKELKEIGEVNKKKRQNFPIAIRPI